MANCAYEDSKKMRLWVSQCAEKSCAHLVYNIYTHKETTKSILVNVYDLYVHILCIWPKFTIRSLEIMHAVNESGGPKPLGFKTKMSTNITVFLAYAPVGRNAKAFQPKKNNNKKKGKKVKDEHENLEPSVYVID